jgi:predicted site-specific integrase-resolvase
LLRGENYMSIILNGETFLRTSEACKEIGISKATLLRWFSSGTVADVGQRDRRGWRLFSANDMVRIKSESTKIDGRNVMQERSNTN